MMNPAITSDNTRTTYPHFSIYSQLKPIIEISAYVLAIGASMILGMLSFCGALVLWPTRLIRACFFFILAVAYEGQIYLQSLRGTLEKISSDNTYERQLTGLYLQEKLAKYDDNRNRILMRAPNKEDLKRVLQFNELLIMKRDNQFFMGFRNKAGTYEERE
ncbi:MAG TPA: hypothetical protein VHD33_08120, partial [Legionellaceae bacterium]|nr:hypothetical protein [Legionellaceae bacterium]